MDTPQDLITAIRMARTSRPLRRLKFKRPKRLIRGWIWGGDELNLKRMQQSTDDIFLGTSDVSDYISSQIQSKRCAQKLETEHINVTLLVTYKEWTAYIATLTTLRPHKFSKERGFLIDDQDLSYISYNIHSSTVEVNVLGSPSFVHTWFDRMTAKFEVVENVIEWIYNSDGQSIEVPLRNDRLPLQEMYPWLGEESLEDYYDRFMQSDASILLLIGPPGTGKTTFIRGLLQHSKQSAVVTYDPAILAKDFVFAQFIEGDTNIFVIEDADNFLGARTDGNDIMHKFLNVGDGLVTTKNKKMIFSTNLPSIRDIDSALVRPGRCFDIVTFDLLRSDEAARLAEKLNVKYDSNSKDKHSIADIFHKQTQDVKVPKRKLGFV